MCRSVCGCYQVSHGPWLCRLSGADGQKLECASESRSATLFCAHPPSPPPSRPPCLQTSTTPFTAGTASTACGAWAPRWCCTTSAGGWRGVHAAVGLLAHRSAAQPSCAPRPVPALPCTLSLPLTPSHSLPPTPCRDSIEGSEEDAGESLLGGSPRSERTYMSTRDKVGRAGGHARAQGWAADLVGCIALLVGGSRRARRRQQHAQVQPQVQRCGTQTNSSPSPTAAPLPCRPACPSLRRGQSLAWRVRPLSSRVSLACLPASALCCWLPGASCCARTCPWPTLIAPPS